MKATEINEWNTTLRFVPNFPQFALNLIGLTTTSVSDTTLLRSRYENVCPRRSSFKLLLQKNTLSKILLWIKPSYFSAWFVTVFGKCVRLLVQQGSGILYAHASVWSVEVPQSKFTELCSSASVVPQSKSTDYNKAYVSQCPTYSMIRNKFYYKVKTLIPNITQLPINGLINELMNSSNYFINIQFIKFQSVLMFVTSYYQSNVIALCCNFDS